MSNNQSLQRILHRQRRCAHAAKALRDADARGVNVEALRANLRKTAARIIAECDPELAVQDPATGPTCRPRAGCSRGG